MTPLEFLELCRSINCLSYDDFKKMFGDEADHFWRKFEDKKLKIVFELDNENISILYKYTLKKIADRNPPK